MAPTTPYPELNEVLRDLVAGVREILGENLCGAYVQGSFAVGEADERLQAHPVVRRLRRGESDVTVRLEPWGEGDLPLLEKLLGDPEMTVHLGGPESAESLAERQAKYERLPDSDRGRMFKIVDEETGEAVGSVGYWEKSWREQVVYETGWSVLPKFQGRGIAVEATTQVIAKAKSDGQHRYLHAFPSVDNAPSNAICAKLGFTLLGDYEFEYPPGSFMQCKDWRLDLHSGT